MRPLIYFAAIIALSTVEGGRILGLFPHTGKSHQMVFEPLLKKLAERGHQVTVVSFFPLKKPIANYTDVSLEGIATLGVETINLGWYEEFSIWTKLPKIGRVIKQLSEFQPLAGMALDVCSKAVDWVPLKEALQKKYDLVLVENFNSDCMMGLLHIYDIKAPVIALLSSAMMPWSSDRIGVTDNPSYVPIISSTFTPTMNLMDRIENTFLNAYHKIWFRYAIQLKEQALIEKYFRTKIPDLDILSRNITLMFLNTFHALNGVKPLVPGIVEVGGMHLDPTRKNIPEYIERFLNESKHGVILLSFGSLIKTSTIPKYKEEIIVNTLSKFKQRVIWKYEESEPEGTLVGNILKVRWLPQFELLQHEKVVAFIAHGGLLGMTESVYSGKPMVVVPFFGDQPSNAAAAANAGFAKIISYIDMTEKDLGDAVRSVLSEEMQLNARRVSKMWQDRESAPLDTAVYWTERVLRWGHSGKLHTAARDLSLYELALIDVFAAYALALTVILLSVWFILTKLMRLIIKESKQKIH
ncbi:UDP-glucosyltransferase 2-like isoform X2 [Danaus plexippus]|uniref:UDP-glucosyltransferase 2-like isoform X2 n=1 Tax=Danaus plexippus TaxID=13037 RepID=UPI002AB09D76|nr:UDP-glucosyltransferase 2-like isoform X2 [Danaus plexippus]